MGDRLDSQKMTFILDVDGVLSTGQFIYSESGKMYKIFGPHDGDGLKLISPFIDIFFITADKRGFGISERRVSDMGFQIDLVTEADRYIYLVNNYDFNQLLFMGDGIHDAKVLRDVLFGITPRNARNEAKESADFITDSNAGEGAVLDACLEIKRRFIDND
jgi:3-deoxy-D-manno-octulosonate 8-phosphate phosphatase (KDO 8-P phosphatase)